LLVWRTRPDMSASDRVVLLDDDSLLVQHQHVDVQPLEAAVERNLLSE
jgi:hypothetical protein